MDKMGTYNIDNAYFDNIIEGYADKKHEKFIKPAFGRGCIADIPEIVEGMINGTERANLNGKIPIDAIDSDHVIVLILDGFGHDLFMYATERYPMKNLGSLLRESAYFPITSVFPSTTATALFTVYMGLQPVEHEIIGYTQYIRELGTVCNMLSMSPIGNRKNDLISAGWMPEPLKGRKSFAKRISDSGTASFIYLPNMIKESGMSKITAAETTLRSYYSTSHMFTSIARDVKEARGKSIHIGYVPSVDTMSHKVGSRTEETALELESIFYNIDMLKESVISTNTTLLISADHGHVNVGTSNLFDISKDRELYNTFRAPVVGDARAAFLRIRCGSMDEARNHLIERYGENYEIFNSLEMLKEGYFGDRKENTNINDRFGDLIMVPRRNIGIIDSNLTFLDPKMSHDNMVGMHGGLLMEEMIVPLIITTI